MRVSRGGVLFTLSVFGSAFFLCFLGLSLHRESTLLRESSSFLSTESDLIPTQSFRRLILEDSSSLRERGEEFDEEGEDSPPIPPPSNDADRSPNPNPSSSLPVHLGPLDVFLSTLLIIISMVIQLKLNLNLGTRIATAAFRCVVQLLLLGLILNPIFSHNLILIVIIWCCFMVAVSALEVTSRPSHGFVGFYANTAVALAAPCFIVLCYCLLAVLGPTYASEARYIIPLLGMLLGNSTTSLTIGYSTLLEDLLQGKDRIEMMLSLGASRWEAVHPLIQRATTQGVMPILNQLSLVGLVSVPGMMTGQLLSGQSPQQAAVYQIMIMFAVTATSTIGTCYTVFSLAFTALDSRHRLRLDRLKPKERKSIQDYLEKGAHKLYEYGNSALVLLITKASDLYYERRRAREAPHRRGGGRPPPGPSRSSAEPEGTLLFTGYSESAGFSPGGSSIFGASPISPAAGPPWKVGAGAKSSESGGLFGGLFVASAAPSQPQAISMNTYTAAAAETAFNSAASEVLPLSSSSMAAQGGGAAQGPLLHLSPSPSTGAEARRLSFSAAAGESSEAR